MFGLADAVNWFFFAISKLHFASDNRSHRIVSTPRRPRATTTTTHDGHLHMLLKLNNLAFTFVTQHILVCVV